MRSVTALLLVPLLALALSGCGKKGDPYAPEGQEEAYTYPNPYPKPGTLVPGGGVAEPEDEEAQRHDTRGTRTKTVITGPVN